MRNPLIAAVELFDQLLDVKTDAMMEAVGAVALSNEKVFDQICEDVEDLVVHASCAVAELSPRARVARLNSIWRNFLKERATASANLDAPPASTDLVQ